MTVTKEQVLDLLPAYALGILETTEMLDVDAYITEHRELLATVHAAEEVVALMALTALPARPPTAVKQELMRRIAADDIVAPGAGALAPPIRLKPPESPGRKWPELLRTVTAVAAGATLFALAIYSFMLSQQMTTLAKQSEQQRETIALLEMQAADSLGAMDVLQNTIADLQTERDRLVATNSQLTSSSAQLDARIQQISAELATDQDRLQLLSTANDAVMLLGGEAAPQSRGAFYVSGPQGVLVIHGLEPLPENQIYQFWWVTEDGTQLPIAPVEVQANAEPTWAVFDVPTQVQSYTVVGLSIEPATGSPQPSGPMILEGGKEG